MLHISLFSGIGGFDLASSWAGWENIVSCEINPFAQRILKYYWPESYHHNDIHTLTYKKIDEELTKKKGPNWRADKIVLSGGFPCQPYSISGKRKGKEDPRHLWPKMLRTIKEIQPDWIVGENVYGLINWNGGMVFNEVQTDLENQGYEVQPYLLPACSKDAPHKRYRIFIVAYRDNRTTEHKIPTGREQFTIPCNQRPFANTHFHSKRYKYRENSKKERKIWRQKKVNVPGKFGSFGITTNTENRSRRKIPNTIKKTRTFKGHQSFRRIFGISFITNSKKQRLQGSKNIGKFKIIKQEPKKLTPGPLCNPWQNFPTKHPLCRGVNGISSKLDRITFSKWRKESLMGYGNAVVPQLVLSIFNTINKYEKLLNENKI